MDYRGVIESAYNRESWQKLLHDIFKNGAVFFQRPTEVDKNSNLATIALRLGTITLPDLNKIAVYEVKLTDRVNIEKNRAEIRNYLVSDWTSQGCAGSFMFCFRDNESVLRFSYVSKTWDFGENGNVEKHETDTKRFTYLLGEGHRSRTAIKQFEELRNSQKKLQDITKAFSIEALSDRFFNDYKNNYNSIIYFITGKRMVKVNNKWEEHFDGTPNQEIMSEFCHFSNPEKAIRDYVKKLMGRLVFLQFIQKKGWLGVPADKEWGEGDKEYLQHLYDHSYYKDDFIDKVLEPLFNDINTQKRYSDIATDGSETKIPYLNGGLFEVDDSDRAKFKLPSSCIKSMFDFFSSYNFTIDENDPDDAEIGVDPEMLGRIFENLLEDNKDKGAFYTPKEIVQYMCRESLIAYLQTDYSEDNSIKESIRQFVTTHQIGNLPEDIRQNIDSKLISVKICDPAIGSGAFPMGLLKELYACRSAIENINEDDSASIKKEIIQNNIYGVDIEKGAVDIARLRFWLALIVDEKTPQALPNMDFKIMQGNSLITTFDGKYINLEKQQHINASKIELLKKELHAKQDSFYGLSGNDKYVRDIEIKNLIIDILKQQIGYQEKSSKEKELQTGFFFDDGQAEAQTTRPKISAEYTELLEKLKFYENQINNSSKSIAERARIEIPFFDWKICFSDVFNRQSGCNDKNGFDIVIGNPPYIQLSNNGGVLNKLYAPCGFRAFASTGDIYCLFYEIGNRLLKPNGHLCYITSNKWMRAGYGEKLRSFLSAFCNPTLLVDFAGLKIFKSATVDTNILIYSKSPNRHSTECVSMNKNNKFGLNNLSDFVRQNHTITSFNDSNSWVILSEIEQSIKRKIESVGTPLKDWDINIYRGVLTGCNEAFIISGEKRDEILANCRTVEERKKTDELIRPILRGRDIKRYGYNWANLYLIATFPSRHYDIDQYPSVKNYLLSFGMERLEQTGEIHTVNGETVKARKLTKNKWFETQDSIGYWEDFLKPKIVYQELTQGSSFALDKNGEYLVSNTGYIISGNNLDYILYMLNSKVIEYCFKCFYSISLGESGLRWLSQYVMNLPIPQISDSLKETLMSSLHDCTTIPQHSIMREDELSICKIYGFSREEITQILNY